MTTAHLLNIIRNTYNKAVEDFAKKIFDNEHLVVEGDRDGWVKSKILKAMMNETKLPRFVLERMIMSETATVSGGGLQIWTIYDTENAVIVETITTSTKEEAQDYFKKHYGNKS